MHSPHEPRVHILLASYQGAAHIGAQLASIAAQTHGNWHLTISDDGSADDTLAICQAFAAQHPRHTVRLIEGPRQRSTANFFHLLRTVAPASDDELFAFCDQDDVWMPDKLTRAISALRNLQPAAGQAALYAARTQLVDEQLRPMGFSEQPMRPLGFGNALLQNVGSGNTMVFNAAARNLLRQAGSQAVVSHDWWVYMLVSGAGGQICYTTVPSVDYRQHGGNLIGANTSWRDRQHRIKRMLAGHFKGWNELNLAALEQCQALLTEPHRQVMHRFAEARRARLPRRCLGVLRSGVYRQTWLGNLGLVVATFLGKL